MQAAKKKRQKEDEARRARGSVSCCSVSVASLDFTPRMAPDFELLELPEPPALSLEAAAGSPSPDPVSPVFHRVRTDLLSPKSDNFASCENTDEPRSPSASPSVSRPRFLCGGHTEYFREVDGAPDRIVKLCKDNEAKAYAGVFQGRSELDKTSDFPKVETPFHKQQVKELQEFLCDVHEVERKIIF